MYGFDGRVVNNLDLRDLSIFHSSGVFGEAFEKMRAK